MSREKYVLNKIDEQREALGFHKVEEMLDLDGENIFLDPFSTLVSKSVVLGEGNIFYPNVILDAKDGGGLVVGDANEFFPATLILAEKGQVKIGNRNIFGDGGFSLKANMLSSEIVIGDRGRYLNGVRVLGRTTLGSGSQVLGPITVQDCNLEPGDNFESADASLRAGLLKGSGLARGMIVPRGQVINGTGTFAQEDIEDQSKYHPTPKS